MRYQTKLFTLAPKKLRDFRICSLSKSPILGDLGADRAATWAFQITSKKE